MATTPTDFPTSLNGGEPRDPHDVRVGEMHHDSHEEREQDDAVPKPDAAESKPASERKS